MELQRDGRVPFTTVARKLGVSEALVRRRVKALTDADMFAITAVADPRVLGLNSMAWVGFVVQPAAAVTFANELVQRSAVDYVVISSGRFNVMAEIACTSSSELRTVLRETRALPAVQAAEPFEYLALAHQQFQWSAETDGRPEHGAVTGRLPRLDPLDVRLVRELVLDGRASFREMARRLNVSERLISDRFTSLVTNRGLKVMAVGNPSNLGLDAMAWLAITTAPDADREAVIAALGKIDTIDYIVIPTGRYDLMAELVCRDRAELLATLTRDVGVIDGIAEVETLFYLRLLFKSSAGAWGVARTLIREGEDRPMRSGVDDEPAVSARREPTT